MELPKPNVPERIRVRPAREDDLERLVTIHAAAFPDARSRETRRRNFTDNVRGGLADLLVAERDGVLVGHTFAFRLGTWIGGAEIPVGGVASVGVAPEARGSGVARALMSAVDATLRARSVPLAMLYPFRHKFYRQLGYGMVCELHRIRVAASSYPQSEIEGVVRGAARPDDLQAVRRCYQRSGERSNGLVVRRENVWRALFAPEGRQLIVVPGASGEVDGYLVYGYLSPPDGLAQELDIIEIVAETDAARRALYGFVHAQRDQVPCVRHVVHAHDPLLAVLDEPRSPDGGLMRALVPVAGEIGAGPMLKLVDVPGALAARGYGTDGRLTVRVNDALGPAAAVACTLGVEAGVAFVETERTGPTLWTDVATLAQIYAGYLRTTDAVRLGRAQVDTWATALFCDALFEAPPFFPLDVF